MYKLREHLDWIHDVISAAQVRVKQATQRGEKLIIEGAVANPETLQELMRVMPGVLFFYFHPRNLNVYEQNLTNRFMLAGKDYRSGLPGQFWKHINDSDFAKYCDDRVMSENLRRSIRAYATASQQDSMERLAAQSKIVKNIKVIYI